MFFYWNLGRFPDTLNVDRMKLMKMAKISSRTTYYKLIRNLSDWNYVEYIPSKIPNGTTTVNMTNICTGKGPIIELESSKNEQPCPEFGHPTIYNKHIKHFKNSLESLPRNEFEVIEYFAQKKWPDNEAMKFFNHYNGVGWKIGGKIEITNWKSVADNWLLKAKEIKNEKVLKKVSLRPDHLMTLNQKNYGKPL